MQWLTLAVLIVILVLLARYHPEWFGPVPGTDASGGSEEQDTGNAPQRAARYDAIDGDSFRLGRREIRLHGIDAPELHQSCTAAGGASAPCGKMARDALTRMARTGQVSCQLVERDRYRREVSECRAGTLNLNREMVRLGWAVAYRKHSRAYIAAEDEARAAKRGIWAMDFDRPEDWRNRNRRLEGNMGGGAGGEIKDE